MPLSSNLLPTMLLLDRKHGRQRAVNRREFISLLGSAAAWPLPTHAQHPAMPVIGYLGAASPAAGAQLMTALRRSLSDAGFIEGRNVVIEPYWAEGRYDRIP